MNEVEVSIPQTRRDQSLRSSRAVTPADLSNRKSHIMRPSICKQTDRSSEVRITELGLRGKQSNKYLQHSSGYEYKSLFWLISFTATEIQLAVKILGTHLLLAAQGH